MASRPGRWVAFEAPPYATQGVYCHACGAMIPRRYWTVDGGDARTYCGPACVELERRVEDLRATLPDPVRPDACRE